MSGGSIWASLELQCCFWIAGGWVVTVRYDTNGLTLQLFKTEQHWHSREAQIQPPLFESTPCEWAFRIQVLVLSELLEYGRKTTYMKHFLAKTLTFIAFSAICLVSRNFLNIGILWYFEPLVTSPETVEAFLWPSFGFITTLLGLITSSGRSLFLSLFAPGWVLNLLCLRIDSLFWFTDLYGDICVKSLTGGFFMELLWDGAMLVPWGSPVARQSEADLVNSVSSISSVLPSVWISLSDLLCSYFNNIREKITRFWLAKTNTRILKSHSHSMSANAVFE